MIKVGPAKRPEGTPIKEPQPATLKKYGLVIEEWWELLSRQGGVCSICNRVPASGRMVVDHEHCVGWKKLPPEKRRLYVRGILCRNCNHYYLARGLTLQRSYNVSAYLERYAHRRGLTGPNDWMPA